VAARVDARFAPGVKEPVKPSARPARSSEQYRGLPANARRHPRSGPPLSQSRSALTFGESLFDRIIENTELLRAHDLRYEVDANAADD
jgi:hypothetical protein